MKSYMLFAIVAGILWGLGGYFEKAGLRALGIAPIAGITLRTAVAVVVLGILSIPAWKSFAPPNDPGAWAMIILGGGIIAGSLGMWSFYSSLAITENLGVTLAIAFAMSPVTGTLIGLLKGTQDLDWKTGVGMLAIVGGIVLIQLAHRPK